ncbi:MAG: hypothetical protein QF492_01525 [Candidatus Krumholzibacteria bacterium]|jgi:hypothetical protein|nr:hypothetical protein [Candidatus Krumholzibacteria bacterium]MDP6668573.1 hypothetical protein [Candidatus Krumholzibacteria bacterium]MDP6796868.1 hypothetical protein [Candidatus Krumholzibacteria bacterium]
MNPNHTLCYFEIPSTDLEASSKFYGELFAWKFFPSDENYTVFETESVGGGIEKKDSIGECAVNLYIQVEDIETCRARAGEFGGKTRQGKTAIHDGEYGYYAMIEDPVGFVMGIWSKT